MQLIINLTLFSILNSVRIAAFRPLERFYKNLYIKILHLLSFIFLKIKFFYNFVNCKIRFTLFKDVKIIKFDLLFVK